ncbi:hypothetical protein SAY86_018289 [Trapa natans]|uniref:Uncharacterized protein n=1 Tax=Trapa natans TaxID=22666 RepID=A0AAN7LN32_TRANT|nr:hypothetical protein SAY86_018289 [Trapa natans]
MTSQRGIHLIQDQNLNLSFSGPGPVGGNVNGPKVQKRGPAGGRKPLGDLSNAGKQLSVRQTFKKSSAKGLDVIQEITVDSSKIKSNATRKRRITKTTDKAQSTSKKALTDISIPEKFCAPEALKINTSKKLGVLAEDSILADAIAEEQFHHNHEECIKMQTCAMNKDCFLETLGLDKGLKNGLPRQFTSPWISPVSSKLKPDSPMKGYMQYEEVADMETANQSPLRLEVPSDLDSPNPCQTPSPEQYSHWKKDLECVDFTLTETPNPFKT